MRARSHRWRYCRLPQSTPAWADSTIIPDPTLTPGAVRTTDAGEICSTGTRQLRHWDRARDDRIMAEYGLPPGPHPDFEIDHLIPLGIGGGRLSGRDPGRSRGGASRPNGAQRPRIASNGSCAT